MAADAPNVTLSQLLAGVSWSGERLAREICRVRRGTSRRAKWDHPATARSKGAELQRSKQIITLEIRVVGEHFLDRHAR
jgi:hypothetical protein